MKRCGGSRGWPSQEALAFFLIIPACQLQRAAGSTRGMPSSAASQAGAGRCCKGWPGGQHRAATQGEQRAAHATAMPLPVMLAVNRQ
jgi:hypothetical protein